MSIFMYTRLHNSLLGEGVHTETRREGVRRLARHLPRSSAEQVSLYRGTSLIRNSSST